MRKIAVGLKAKVKAKTRQGVGKVRRFALGRLAPGFVAAEQMRRVGECVRCGVCCRLLFRCPWLEALPDGGARCRHHDRRPDNCRIFPVNESCIRDRDTLAPDIPCGYRFVPRKTQKR